MSKKLDISSITNELAGSSAFFPSYNKEAPSEEVTPHSPVAQSQPTVATTSKPKKRVKSNHATMTPRHHDTMVSSNHDTTVSQSPSTIIEKVRKAVRELGKEAATHRFTVDEKKAIANIIYTYSSQDIRTSENEIARIAVNYIVSDYLENGEESILDKVLKELNR